MKKEDSTKKEITSKKIESLCAEPILQEDKNDSDLNFALALDATILETKVGGFLQKKDNVTEVLVLPTEVDPDKILTLKDLVFDIGKHFGISESTITEKLNSIKTIFPNFNPDDVSFQLKQLFFYMKTGSEKENENVKEYALSIKINLKGSLDFASIISIDTLYLAVWNTKRKVVLEEMKLADLSELLPAADEKK